MFQKILIANRGAIAVRIARTLRAMNIDSVAVYAAGDIDSQHIDAANECVALGDGGAADTYNNQALLLDIIRATGCDALHPGYGFLSENAHWAARLAAAGVTFIGPQPRHLSQFGLKHEARALARAAGVSLLPGSGLLQDADQAVAEAHAVGYPVMLKSSAGGGGIGMQRCADDDELRAALAGVQRLAATNFGDDRIFLERCVDAPRHVEVQAFGDGRGNVVTLGDRDCSLQRRHQKVIEECPAPNLPSPVRAAIHEQSRRLLAQVNYESAGTVEFLYDAQREEAYFLEVNTRLQVEHGVTEMVYGVDLVEWMIRQAAGELTQLDELQQALTPTGHAVQARLYAEDPARDFRPSPGELTTVTFPDRQGKAGAQVRVDTWIRSGTAVPSQFDPLLAKIIAHGPTRSDAIATLRAQLCATELFGIETNLAFLDQALATSAFAAGTMHNQTLAELAPAAHGVEVLSPGAATTVQAWPGRVGLWSVGVPPSGPMDMLSFRLGNALIGNAPSAAGLEITMAGPTLRFAEARRCVVTGAPGPITINDQPVEPWRPFCAPAGSRLVIGALSDGARSYLLIDGGIAGRPVLGSQATFTLANLGGHGGRNLRVGDVLPLAVDRPGRGEQQLARFSAPALDERHQLRVTLGPHCAPDFLTKAGLEAVLSASWEVHYNSSRTGVRLIGPAPTWAREDGGEAGLHPSNIHDNAYAIGAIDFTGDQPVILGPDGPSLGGFVCPATVITADLWKLGQLRAGDRVALMPVDEQTANDAARAQETAIRALSTPRVTTARDQATRQQDPVLLRLDGDHADESVTVRRAGDAWLLVEFGPMVLDIGLRLRAQAFIAALARAELPGIIEVTPGIRSVQLHFDFRRWTGPQLAKAIAPILEQATTQIDDFMPPSRIVHLPLSWDDPACHEAIGRYTQSVRSDAPWCPDNIEFIRRINGLPEREDVKRIVFDASYLVMGLGDVYLGAPVATPMNPAHRLVTTKYNPARTWTAENSVGIGGSYLCVYGMEGPGGYQFIGRTLQVWNHQPRGGSFTEPYLLRPFDQIRFTPVDAEELLELREAFPRGRHELTIEPTHFSYQAYRQQIAADGAAIEAFTTRRQAAFAAELDDWRRRGLLQFDSGIGAVPDAPSVPDGIAVHSPLAGAIWTLTVAAGEHVRAGDTVAIVEAMKTEFPVTAPADGTVKAVLTDQGATVAAGQAIMVLSA